MSKLHYRDLVVWQRAIDLMPHIYAVIRKLPREETYALGDQLRRAAISIPANIAEGQGRQHPREFLQYLAIARGSLAELNTLLIIAQRLDYLTPPALDELDNVLQGVAKPLHGLMGTLAKRLPTNNQEPTPRPDRPRH
jgi:four helix bundle protein